jgi:hypothetical protein
MAKMFMASPSIARAGRMLTPIGLAVEVRSIALSEAFVLHHIMVDVRDDQVFGTSRIIDGKGKQVPNGTVEHHQLVPIKATVDAFPELFEVVVAIRELRMDSRQQLDQCGPRQPNVADKCAN